MITPASACSRWIPVWLITCLTCVVLMVFIGGVTRLTESGLSIVEWKLVSGILPPLTHEAWETELEAYRATPQYQQINRGMSVSEFKQIFWLEWLHRLMGRLTGLIFAIPFFYFLLRRQMDGPLTLRMTLACLLVGAQGAVGWIMVKSGLVDDPRVSPIRLALHLSLAFGVFCLVLWTYWHIRGYPRIPPSLQSAKLSRSALSIRMITLFIAIQTILGALVAGQDAGLSYNSWPLMDGEWIPSGLMLLEPWTRNLLENITMVQFQHRIMAYAVAISIVFYAASNLRHEGTRPTSIYLLVAVFVQFALGVLTLIHVVPIGLASAHQLMALFLLALCLHACYQRPLSGGMTRRNVSISTMVQTANAQ